MRLALISDIHGNTVALDAVLAEIAARDVDSVVCLGDIAASGPDPSGAIERVAEVAAVSVQGNTDAGMVEVPEWWHDPASIGLPEAAHRGLETAVWTAEQIDADHRRYLAQLPITAEVELPGGSRLLAFHGSPRSFDDIMTATTPDDEVGEMIGDSDHDVLAGGHLHVQLVRRYGTQMLLNAGSVGMPFAEYGFAGRVAVLARADYALLAITADEVSIELRQVATDEAALSRLVRTSGMPHAEWWLGQRRRV